MRAYIFLEFILEDVILCSVLFFGINSLGGILYKDNMDEKIRLVLEGLGYSALGFSIIELIFSNALPFGNMVIDSFGYYIDAYSPEVAAFKIFSGVLLFAIFEIVRWVRSRTGHYLHIIGFTLGSIPYLLLLSFTAVSQAI